MPDVSFSARKTYNLTDISRRRELALSDLRWCERLPESGDPWRAWLALTFSVQPAPAPDTQWLEAEVAQLIRETDAMRLKTKPDTKKFDQAWRRYIDTHVDLEADYAGRRDRYLIWRAAALTGLYYANTARSENDAVMIFQERTRTMEALGPVPLGPLTHGMLWRPRPGEDDALSEYAAMTLLLVQCVTRARQQERPQAVHHL
jgi:hypothetical protein